MGQDTLSAQWAGGVRDGYPAGVPCWIDTTQPDPRAAADFYAGLLGWDLENMMPTDSPGQYFVARKHGLDVAAISSNADGGAATWNTYVWVDNADETAHRVEQAGGRVLAAPFDVPGAGRMAECEDPAGATFRLWQAREHRGAQLVNAPGSWNWSNLNAPDPQPAMRFYAAVFGWEFSELDFGAGLSWMVRVPGYADFLEVRNPGVKEQHAASGAPPGFTDAIGWLQPAPSDAKAHWSVTISVADADAVAARTSELGGTVVSGPIDVPYSRLLQITDPQGAAVTLSQFKMPD
ncbi:MAG: VOC family protein [Chloroflexi bacterium]|nr:VOC family protein [Chloroflexota bacterium]